MTLVEWVIWGIKVFLVIMAIGVMGIVAYATWSIAKAVESREFD